MSVAKKTLEFEDIDAQTAVALPDREMMALVNILITDLLNNNQVNVQVPIGVAANVCGVNANVLAHQGMTSPVDCTASNTGMLPVAFRP